MAQVDFRATYDAESDVLYTSIGDPQRCDCSEGGNVIWRFSRDNGKLVGATIIGYKELGIDMSVTLATHYNLPPYYVANVINGEIANE